MPLQFRNTVLLLSSWYFAFGILFAHMVVHSLFLGDCTSFQLTFQSLLLLLLLVLLLLLLLICLQLAEKKEMVF